MPGLKRLSSYALALFILGLGQPAYSGVMQFPFIVELDESVTTFTQVTFSWDEIQGVLTGDPAPLVGPNVLDCFPPMTGPGPSADCEVTHISMQFKEAGATTATLDLSLTDPDISLFTGLLNDTYSVAAMLTDFAYDVSNGECSGLSDVICLPGMFELRHEGDTIVEFEWLGWLDIPGPASGGASPISYVATDDDECIDCGSFNISSPIPTPLPISLMALGLMGIVYQRYRPTNGNR